MRQCGNMYRNVHESFPLQLMIVAGQICPNPKIQSRRKFRPKFEVGRNSAKSAKTAGVALFFPPTVSSSSLAARMHKGDGQGLYRWSALSLMTPAYAPKPGKWEPIGPPRIINENNEKHIFPAHWKISKTDPNEAGAFLSNNHDLANSSDRTQFYSKIFRVEKPWLRQC